MALTPQQIQQQIDEDGGELADVKRLVPWDKNPRQNQIAAEKLADFISQRGWGAPVLVQRGTGRIIGGHTRWKAAKKLGLDRIPVRYRTCDDRTADALALADNKLGEVAEWNAPGVAEILSGFGLEEAEAMGWDSKALEDLAKEVDGFGPLDAAEVTEDEVPEPPKVPVTKAGDVWRLGRHELRCASAFDFAPAGARLVLTDPPYGVNHVGGTKDPRSESHRSGKPVYNDAPEQLDGIVRNGLGMALGACADGAAWYVCAPPGPAARTFIDWMDDAGVLRQIMVWAKDSFVFGRSYYHYRHELILYGWKPGAAHHALHDRTQDTVWEFDRPKKSEEHPTMKPVAMFAKAITNSTDDGAVVHDPFLGSGTTLIAAEQTNRTCVGTEIDPAYCDVIVERWQNLTGGKAERAQG